MLSVSWVVQIGFVQNRCGFLNPSINCNVQMVIENSHGPLWGVPWSYCGQLSSSSPSFDYKKNGTLWSLSVFLYWCISRTVDKSDQVASKLSDIIIII